MKKIWFIVGMLILVAIACQNKPSNEKRIEEINAGGNAELIRNPASADGLTDTTKLAKMTFEEVAFDFGEVKEGEVVTHIFKFKNTGKVPLIISDARSTCGCTIPEWSKEPIQPGESSAITVRFNTQGKADKQKKPVTITANTYPSETKVYLTGVVKGLTE